MRYFILLLFSLFISTSKAQEEKQKTSSFKPLSNSWYFAGSYNISVKISGSEANEFRHGFTFRLKFYHKKDNWDYGLTLL
jgi:hypothetical protein